ncbi:MAG: hypothetical protein ACJAUC_002570 [Planctomycetota bacterium]|jgi:hypothetical protein
MSVLLLLAVGLYAARGPLFGRMMLRRAQTVLGTHFGGQLEIKSISGDWLTGIELHDITLRNGEVVREISGGHARLDLGILSLWRGRIQDLSRLQFHADRVLIEVPANAIAANSWTAETMRQVALRAVDAALGGVTANVDDLEIRARGSMQLRGSMRLEVPARAAGSTLQASLLAPSLQLTASVHPDGALSLQASSPTAERIARVLTAVPQDVAGELELTIEAAAASAALAITGAARNVAFADNKIASVTMQATLTGQELTIDSLVARDDEAQVTLHDFHANLFDLQAGVGSVRIPAASLRPLLERLPLGLATSSAWPQLAIELNQLSGTLEFTLRDSALHAKQTTLQTKFATLEITDGMVPLSARQRNQLRVGATLVMADESMLATELPSWARSLPARPVAGQVRLQGSHRDDAFHLQCDANLSLRTADGLGGTLSGSFQLPIGKTWELQTDCKIDGPLLRGLPATTVSGQVQFEAVGDDYQATFEPLVLQADGVGRIELRGQTAALSDWRQAWPQSNVSMQLRDLVVARFLDIPPTGSDPTWVADLRGATINGLVQTGKLSSAQVQIDWPELQMLGDVVAKVVADASADGVALRSCQISTDIGDLQLGASWPKATLTQLLTDPASILAAPLQATAEFASKPLRDLVAPDRATQLAGSVGADVQVRGSLSEPVVALQVRQNDAALEAVNLRWSGLTGGLRYEAGTLHILDAGVSVGETAFRASGKVANVDGVLRGQLDSAATDLPAGVPDTELLAEFAVDANKLTFKKLHVRSSLVQVDSEEVSIAGGLNAWSGITSMQGIVDALAAPLEARLKVTVPDLSLLPGLASRRNLVGRIAADVSLTGTLRAPTPTVTAQVEGISFRIPDGPRVDDVRARIVAEPTRIDCQELTATVSGGAVAGHGTFVSPQAWWLTWQQGELNAALTGKDVLLRRRNGIKVRSDLNLTATGPVSHLQLKGTLATQASKVVQRLPYFTLGNVGGPDTARGLTLTGPDLGKHVNVHLDLAVTSAQPIQIRTNVLAGEVSSALVVRGTLRAPRIEGTLAMPRGTITFPGCTFRTSNALLQFDRNDSSFPTVSLTAAGRRHGYDVRMVIRGSYHAPEIQLSSTPPLPAEQLAVLVTTGARPESLQGSRAVGALLGSYLVQELADHLFGSESTEAKEGFVSRFEVETGTEISANGTESIVVNFRVIDHVYLQGERDIYEDVNVGLVYRIRFK